MKIPIVDSRNLPNTWRMLDDKLGNPRDRGLPFRFPYVGSFSQAFSEFFIRVYSNPGDVIMEPFGGRGTTAMQALFHGRHVIVNDLSPYSNVLCHSVMYPPYSADVISFIRRLERYVNSDKCNVSTNYPGKGSTNDIKRLYHEDTFDQLVKSRNVLNHRDVLMGFGSELFGDIGHEYIDDTDGKSNKNNIKRGYLYRHEVVMFTRMVMSQLMLNNSSEMAFNGIKTRGSDNTNIKALLRYYESMGERPAHVNIFDKMVHYVEKMGLDGIGIRDRFNKLNRKLISCDARRLSLPDKCADMVLTSPPYFAVLNYGMANWIRLWAIDNIGDPLVTNVVGKVDKANTSEIHGKLYDKATDSTGSTVDNPMRYSSFTGQYLKELYRILKDDAVAIIVVGDYGNKKKVDAWRLVTDRAEIFGFKPKLVIMDELNKDTKSSSQFNLKQGGGKNDYDVAVVLYKGNYEIKNNPEDIDFRWGAKFADARQLNIEDAWN